jgi:hypothetical protein
MSKFEDHLWQEFVREHGGRLAQMRRPPAQHAQWAWPRVVVGASLGLAAAGGVAALVLGATPTSPAFAVTRNRDGTVTVKLQRLSGIAGTNAKLRHLGIRAKVLPRAPVRCYIWKIGAPRPPGPARSAGRSGTRPPPTPAHWTIDPRKVPSGKTLVLAASPGRHDQRGESRGGRQAQSVECIQAHSGAGKS